MVSRIFYEPIQNQQQRVNLIVVATTWEGQKFAFKVGEPRCRKWPDLFNYQATFVESPKSGTKVPPVRITLPDGTLIASDQREISQILSRALSRNVTFDAANRGRDDGAAPSRADSSTAKAEEYWPDIEGLVDKGAVGSGNRIRRSDLDKRKEQQMKSYNKPEDVVRVCKGIADQGSTSLSEGNYRIRQEHLSRHETRRRFCKGVRGRQRISRNLYEGRPPPFGTELSVPLTQGDTVEVRIGTPRTEGSNGEINADEI
jgi:hypothetical protein